MTELETVVTCMRRSGATVFYNQEEQKAAVDVLGHNKRRFVDVEYVNEAVNSLSIRAMTGDLTKADYLLLTILEEVGVVPTSE